LKGLAAAAGLLILVLGFFGLILYLTSPDVTFLATSNPTTTAFIELRRLQAKQEGSDFHLQWTWIPLSKISPFLIYSVIQSEDATFWQHKGIEWSQIKHSLNIIWHTHRIVTGGSTITQQVAKNLYLYPDQTLLRKCRELFIARELEKHLSKERILEIYLNIAEWGNGVFGAEAASQHWYQRSASELTPQQAANLALIIPAPKHRDPTNLSPKLRKYANRLLFLMVRDRLIQYETAMQFLNIPQGPLDENTVYILSD
jgi:monofunctional biosynthetic peptidoglycan transglycosylase